MTNHGSGAGGGADFAIKRLWVATVTAFAGILFLNLIFHSSIFRRKPKYCTPAVLIAVLLAIGWGSPALAQNWTQQNPATSPSARENSAMVYDSVHHQVVLFGGQDSSNTPLNETWVWDGVTWTQKHPVSSPAARIWPGMAFDAAHGRVVLFGGSPSGGSPPSYIQETWLWDGSNWTQASPPSSPSGRQAPAMAYDSTHQQVVLFGGQDGMGPEADTWVWNGSTWTFVETDPSSTPTARRFAVFSHDPVRQQTVLFGGDDGLYTNSETWTWNGVVWTQQSPAHSPSMRDSGGQVWDSVRQLTVMWGANPGNDTWLWNGTDWTQETPAASPPSRFYGNVAYDSEHAQTVLFGGLTASLSGLLNDTWTLGYTYTSNWTELTGSVLGGPGVRIGMAAATWGNTVYLFGGNDQISLSGNLYNDTWLWNGTQYAHLLTASSPPVRWRTAMVYSPQDNGLLLFGGNAAPLGDSPIADTWLLNGNWTQQALALQPPARDGHAMVYDAGNSNVVLFGGYGASYLNDTWIWSEGEWNAVAPATSPAVRTLPAMVYDAARSQVLLFGGGNSGGYLNDTWVWDGANWTQKTPATSPPARYGAAMIYDATHGTVLLFGGQNPNIAAGSGFLNDLWQWDGVNWTQLNPATLANPRFDAAAAYDSSSQQVLVFGGTNQGGPLGDTTLFASPYVSGAALPTGYFEVPYSYTLSPAGGVGPYTFTETGEPYTFAAAGLSLNANTGAITGTDSVFPGQPAIGIGVTIRDSQGQSTVVTFSLNTDTAIVFSPGPLPDATMGTNYSLTLPVSGGTAPYVFGGTGLPAGLSISGNQIVGLCTGSSSNVMLTVTDSLNGMASAGPLTLNCNPAPAITTASLPAGEEYVFYSAALATNAIYDPPGAAPYTWSVTSGQVPTGLNLNANGTITGIPQNTGTFTFTITFTDRWGAMANKPLKIAIQPPLTISTFSLANGNLNLPYPAGQALAVTGGLPPFHFVADDLPPGLAIDPNTGAISGTPTIAGPYTASFSVTDQLMNSAETFISLVVSAPGTNPQTWVEASPSFVPASREGASMFYDPVHSQTILFGGNLLGETGIFNDTNVWDGSNWTALSPASSPTPRGFAMTAFDVAHGQGVLFGGQDNNGFPLGDTWLWNGSTWTKQNPAASPPARRNAVMAWDGHRIMLFGGTANGLTDMSDTWSWDGTTWTQLSPAASPPQRQSAAAAFDSSRGKVVLFGGLLAGSPNPYADTWLWDGAAQTWTQPSTPNSPPARFAHGMAFDSVHNQTVLFGGQTPLPSNFPDTWEWDGTKWGQLNPPQSPSPRGLQAMAYHTAASEVVLFAGYAAGADGDYTDTWLFGGPSITNMTLPPGTQGQPYNVAVPNSGGFNPVEFFASPSALPPGISLNTNTGILGGTPGQSGDFTIPVTVQDDYGNSIVVSLALHINVPSASLSITTASPLPPAVVQVPYTATFAAVGGVKPYSWSTIGAPAWLNITAGGVLTGTPPAGANTITFQVKIADSATNSVTATFQLPVNPPIVINTTPPVATVNVVYSAMLAATGGSGAYGWSAAGLPAGFTLTGAGLLSGKSVVAGSYPFQATATDSATPGASATAQVKLLVSTGLPLSFATQSLNGCVTDTACSNQISASGGIPPYTFTLPPATSLGGLTLSSNGLLSGTPNFSGQLSFTVTLTDQQTSISKTFNLTVAGSLTVSTNSLPAGTVGVNYGTQMAASGGSPPYTWGIASGSLPAGLTLDNPSGIIYGKPTAPGNSTFSVKVTDGNQTSPPQQLTIAVSAPPPPPTQLLLVSPAQLDAGMIGKAYSQSLSASGGNLPYAWSLTGGSLPAGLTLTPNGLISGTPTAAQTARFNAKVTDGSGTSVNASFSILITDPSTVSLLAANPLPNGAVGVAYNYAIQVTGGTAPYFYAITQGQVPPGLIFDSTNGTLSGTPTLKGNFTLVLTVTDSGSAHGASDAVSMPQATASQTQSSANYTIQIAGAGDFQITTGASLPAGTVGQSYTATLTASGGTQPYTWQLMSGDLPAGLTLNPSGRLTGTPTAAGTVSLLIQAADSSGLNSTGNFLLEIASATTPAITPSPLPAGIVGTAYQAALSAVGGKTPYTWSMAVGTLPPGLALDPASGALSGTPTTKGNFGFTVRVTDGAGAGGSQAFTIRVNAATLSISPPAVPNGLINAPYSAALGVIGGSAPYTWSLSAGGLLSGFSIDAASGTISGTPTQAGTYQFTISVVDTNFDIGTRSYQFTVQSAVLSITTNTAPAGTVGTPYALSLLASNGTLPLTWSVTSGSLPPGISLGPSTGQLTGTPTAAGTYSFTVQVQDATKTTAQVSLTVAVNPAALSIVTASLPAGSIGVAYNQTLTSSGGHSPVTWSVAAGALPGGLSLGPSSGSIAGTPTQSGSFNFTVQALDSAGATAKQSYMLTIAGPPPAPSITVSGLPANSNPGDQPTVTITLNPAYPLPIVVTATLSITPSSPGSTDLMFSNGTRSTQIMIPANTTQTTLTFQVGTLPGTIQLSLDLMAAGVDITPAAPPAASTKIAGAAPAIKSVAVATITGGLQITVVGVSTTLDMKTAAFHFTAAAGATLQTTDISVDVSGLFASWYQSTASQATGSQFSFTIPFSVGGNVSTIASVTVTMTNSAGSSAPVTALVP